jgi:uncharacterized protein (TIGR03437 family)
MSRKTWVKVITGAVLTAAAALGATFGTVVPIGGQATDIALDEARGVLYIANFTANRIDVMQLANQTIQTSINVNPNPNSISLSPDGHWLLVAHFGNNSAPASPTNALTLIDLTANNSKQVISLGNPPLGVAFGIDDNALVVTTNEFIQFNPALGTTQTLQTIAQVATNAIPQPPGTFANQFAQASVAASRDGLTIAGFGGTSPYLLFRYNVGTKVITGSFYTSQPPAGPRVVSVADDGSITSFAWWVADAKLNTVAQWGNASGLLNVGTTVVDSSRSLIYAQIPPSGTAVVANNNPPMLMINDWDNLTVEDQLYLPENFAGKALLSNDHNTIYGISDSGVMILPIGNLASYPRVKATTPDLVFRGNFCDRSVNTQTLTIVDPGGGSTPFSISAPNGIRVSPSNGVTPAVVSVSVDPNVFANRKGTVAAALTISSSAAINFPVPVRVLISSPDPSQRGSFVDIPGRVVDIAADPKRQLFYVLRQDQNQVLVYSEGNNTLQAILRTCTTPTSMAITFDQQDLLVGCDNSHYMNVFDLDLLQAQTPVYLPWDYVESIATSSNAILAMVRTADGSGPKIDQIDLVTHSASRLPSLGVWQNQLTQDTVLTSSSNGANILAVGADGSVLIYSAVAGTFTVSRHDFTSLSGSYAASNFNQYEVGNHLLDSSGVPKMTISTSTGSPSGFAFVNQTGYFTTALNTSSPGTIAQVDTARGTSIQPTAMIEAPILGNGALSASNIQNCTTNTTTNATNTITMLTCVIGTTETQTITTCPINSTNNCNTTNTVGVVGSPSFGLFSPSVYSAFTRSLAPLPDQSEIVALTTSGFTVLPWTYAASVAAPQITKVASAADGSSPVAPGGLVSIFGNQLNPTNLATSQIPLPTALANSCLTVNGQPMPLVFVSPTQINAQMPTEAVGAVTLNVHTPGGVSDNYNIVVNPTAPAVFMSGVAGPQTNLPTVVRDANNTLVTDSNPIHRGDTVTIYLTGIGQTAPVVGDGLPAPVSPLAIAVQPPAVQLGGVNLPVNFAGLAPGQVGVGQINVTIPSNVPEGLNMPLTISQGGSVQALSLRVVQ